MAALEFRKWGRGVAGESIKDHLQTLASARSNLVQGAYFLFLAWILEQVMKSALAVEEMGPIPDHPEVSDLRINPAALLEGVLIATQPGDKGFAIQLDRSRGIHPGEVKKGRVEIGKINQIP